MTTIADLAVRIGVRGAKDAASDLERVDNSAKSMGSRMAGVARGVAKFGVGIAAVGVGAIKVGKDWADASSNLGESVNAIEQVFGPASKTIKRFGETSAQTVGLSTRAFNEMATPIGASLRNVGFSADDAATSSIKLTQRAADMASVFNTDVGTALEAIQAGLRGEADPLERFGVGLSAAAVEAHAMKLGLADATGGLSDQAKAQARISLLMEQSNRVAGDFKNTSGGLANQQRILAAEYENVQAKLGQKLLPIATKIASFLLTRMIPAFEQLGAFIVPVIQRIVAGVQRFFGSLTGEGGGALQSFIARMTSIGRTVAPIVVMAITTIGAIIRQLAATALPILMQVGRAMFAAFRSALPHIKSAMTSIREIVVTVLAIVREAWRRFGPFITKYVATVFKTVVTVVSGLLKAVAGVVKLVLAIIRGDWSGAWKALQQITAGVMQAVRGVVSGAIGVVKNLIAAGVSFVRGRIRQLQEIPRLVGRFFTGAKDAAQRALGRMVEFVGSIPGRIVRALGSLGGLLTDAGRNLINGLLDGIRSAAGRVLDEVRSLASKIRGFLPFSPAKEGPLRTHPFDEGGANLMGDLARGINRSAPGVVSSIRSAVAGLADPIGNINVRGAASATGRPQPIVLEFAGGADSQLATVLMRMLRSGDLPAFEGR